MILLLGLEQSSNLSHTDMEPNNVFGLKVTIYVVSFFMFISSNPVVVSFYSGWEA